MFGMISLIAVLAGGAAWALGVPDSVGTDWSQIPEYRIVPGDKLALNFGPNSLGTADQVREVLVRPDGRITVFPAGDVIAAGRTARELEATLVQLLAAELKSPRVVVEVASLAANQVHVLGQVEKPGSYPLSPFMTLTQVVAEAGGFTDDAARNSIMVFHRDGARTVRVSRVRLDHALKRGSLEADIPLSRFDIVYVPRSSIGNVDVFVHQFFAEPSSILGASLTGWELFNLDRVFVGAKLKTQ
jgi:protein involved in polysaccharide export with SLBB domain